MDLPQRVSGYPPRKHKPDLRSRRYVVAMRAANVAREQIAEVLEISPQTLDKLYALELAENPVRGGLTQHEPTPMTRGVVEAMAACGTPQEQIATIVGIGIATLREHYVNELQTAAIKANSSVARSLFMQAVGGPTKDWTQAVLGAGIWWTKARMGWKEQPLEVTTPDGRPFQIEDSPRDILIGRIAGIAERIRAGEDARGSDRGPTGGAGVGLELLGPPRTDDASGVDSGGAGAGPMGDMAGAGGPRLGQNEDGV